VDSTAVRRASLIYLLLSGGSAAFRSMIYIVVAVYYVQTVHLNPLQLVLVGTVLESAYFLCQIPTGVLADVVSRRLSVIVGLALVGVCFVLEGMVPLFLAILGAEVLRGLGEAAIDGAESAWLAGEVGDAQVGGVYVRSGQITQLCGLAGTLAGVALASIHLNLPVALGGVLLVGLSVVLAFSMPEQGFTPVPRGDATAWQTLGDTVRHGWREVRGRPVLMTLLGTGFFGGAASEGFDRLWEAHLLINFTFPALGALKPVVWFGIIGVLTMIVSALALRLLGTHITTALASHAGTARALLILDGLGIAAVVAFALAGDFGLAVAALCVKAVAGTLSTPLYNTWMIQNIDPRVRATVLSMSGQANALGQVAGGPVIGAVGTAYGLRLAIAAAAALLSPSLALYGWALRRGEGQPSLDERALGNARSPAPPPPAPAPCCARTEGTTGDRASAG
jgi:DHA3 family tetracycline resistance protein-like MFS transporter